MTVYSINGHYYANAVRPTKRPLRNNGDLYLADNFSSLEYLNICSFFLPLNSEASNSEQIPLLRGFTVPE